MAAAPALFGANRLAVAKPHCLVSEEEVSKVNRTVYRVG